MSTLEHLESIQACPPAINWVTAQRDQSPRALWLACPQGEWQLWLADDLRVEIPDAAYRPALLRLLREYAPVKLRAAGLGAEAARLEALPDDVDWAAAEAAADAAARWAPDPEAEHAQCAAEVRAAMGDAVIEAWERALKGDEL